uniref:DEAD-box ATP-dependent RNA helicase 41 n=1 Tax=Anthurium amnicola TaxID=1678845 RepID=A0A1D1YXZ5_9ARAE
MEVNDQGKLQECPLADDGEAGGADSPVKERCWDQREALPGEPRCVVCSRYGEYICDETDDDICSTECKKILLGRLASTLKAPVNRTPPEKLPGYDECFYVGDNVVDQIQSLRRKINVRVKGDSVPAPVLSFSSFGLPSKLQENLEIAGYKIPTPVQMQAVPAAIKRKNLLVSADTGSGKTASFLVPVIAHCSDVRSKYPVEQKRPLALVLAPTRELCVQVEEQAKLLGKGLPFKTALVVGGDALPSQVYRLMQGIELIVGTPGRLIDLLTKHNFELEDICILVLDEVDCMLQRGFRDQVMQIFQALSQPQVLMFSATISKDVEKMASLMCKDLICISAGKPSRPNELVTQVVIWVDSKHKKQKLFDILRSRQHFKPPAVVFVESRLGADLLSEAITVATGIKALSIHGEKGMKERRETMRLFLTGEVSVVVATGVLGRGVDLVAVNQVIIFDMPNSMEEYIHQVGRASRMGEKGTAIVFVNEEDKRLFKELLQVLRSSGSAIPRELANSCYSMESQLLNNKQKRRKRCTDWE